MFKDKTTILAISYRRKGFSLRAMYMKFSILSFSFVTEGLQANHCCFMTISEPQHRKASIMRAKREIDLSAPRNIFVESPKDS